MEAYTLDSNTYIECHALIDYIACSIEYMHSWQTFYLYSWSRSSVDDPTTDLDCYTCIWSMYVDAL